VFYGCIGTGIGAGIIFDRKIFSRADRFRRREGGHVSIDYPRAALQLRGNVGCIEALASGTAICAAGAAGDLLRIRNVVGDCWRLRGGNAAAIRSEMVGARGLDTGDELAREIFVPTQLNIWQFGWAISWICWNPEVMILGRRRGGNVAAAFWRHSGADEKLVREREVWGDCVGAGALRGRNSGIGGRCGVVL